MSPTEPETASPESVLSKSEVAAQEAVPALERGTYEILRDRLLEQSAELARRANTLNAQRLELFGGTEMALAGNERIRTENNCIPCDIRPVGKHLLFGYNVFLGLKTETRVEDVLAVHRFEATADGFDLGTVPIAETFLADTTFQRDFQELTRYYKDTRLMQLRRVEGRLLAVFRTGAGKGDIKVFRWAIDPQGQATYIDNRGERDHVFPPSHDFEWIRTTREHHVHGRHPHVNILDQVFVETVGGDLTVKVEDNTEDGLGIYREPVDEPNQSLDDGEIHYARVGSLILLKIKPYNEPTWRYLVFNTRSQQVDRIDAIGQACILLPEDHGLIFPGGYYLQSGETKSFEGEVAQMELMKTIRSPNGEDVLYVFHERESGLSILLSYNMIRKQVENPIHCHGFSFFDDGRLVIFRAADEPTRVHPMQIWQTPFMSDEHAAQMPTQGTFLEKVGNADLVRGISDSLSICRAIEQQEPTLEGYEELIANATRAEDAYYWMGHEAVGDLASPLAEVKGTADHIVGEFVKVQAIRRQAREAVAESEKAIDTLFETLRKTPRSAVDHFVDGLAELRRRRGQLLTVREMRYADLARVDALEQRVIERFDQLSGEMVAFLEGDEALSPYHRRLEELVANSEAVAKVSEAVPLTEGFQKVGESLELLTEVVGGLQIDDATVRTRILEDVSEVMAGLNRGRAILEARRQELLRSEGSAEFGAQFKLFGQAVSGALAAADSPEKCDEQLSKLMLQLEELESRFGELDEFLEPLAAKREDVYEVFSSKKQALLDARQRRAGRLVQAAQRILDGIVRRASTLGSVDDLNTYFVGDAMVAKVRDLARQLREIKDSVKADELESRLKAAREDAGRSLRDRQDIFEEGAEIIKLGRHRFSVNTQAFDLTMVPRLGDEGETAMAFHLTGTDFYEMVADPEFLATRDYWDQLIVSESPQVYRGEYLAASILFAAEVGQEGLDLESLHTAVVGGQDEVLAVVRRFAAERYDEGYERGLHDQDAALILEKLLALYSTADLLRFAPGPRSKACLFWAFFGEPNRRVSWERRARSLARLRASIGQSPALGELARELGEAMGGFFEDHRLALGDDERRLGGEYLFEELAKEPQRFVASAEALDLRDRFLDHLKLAGSRRAFEDDLKELADDLTQRHALAQAWLRTFLEQSDDEAVTALAPALAEAVVLLLTEGRLEQQKSSALSTLVVEGLLGQHRRIQDRKLSLRLDELLTRMTTFRDQRVPGFRHFQDKRHRLLERERRQLRLDEYKPKVMSSFVRNRLINEVYLPILGDNLAKQMGSAGEGKRTDQMGLLLLISPPGYGKTTLMEYVANRLGLVFVKVNGPALGHGVTSIDPDEAPNATARQEVEKINFALEMGNNVLLYLDDIQHTHSELLQKFISLCDAQRRMEGVWEGRTRTYDLKGKRFAVCMAGNPYTESGDKFQIPDMLANRADTYNLGDILEGKDQVFALSYIENSLTSNRVLAPLTTRSPGDLFKLVRMAQGEAVPPDQLEHGYSQVELEEILSVLRKLVRVQEVVLAINQQYILSAAQDDAFRTEPRFQLQGSYRNMNKMAEKVEAVMNEAELEALIDDHYAGEAQTLTTGTEHNLLKLAELRGTMTDEQRQRWDQIKRGFARVQAMGGAEDDPAVRLIGQLGLMSDRLSDIDRAILKAAQEAASREADALAVARASEEQDEPETDRGDQLASHLASALGPFAEKIHQTLEALHAAQAARAAAPAGETPRDDDRWQSALTALGERVDTFLERLAELARHAAEHPAAVPPDGQAPARPAIPPVPGSAPEATPLAPYLDKLDATLQVMATDRGSRVVQALGPGVLEIFDRLSAAVGENLIPAVQGLGRHMKTSEVDDRRLSVQLDRTLKNLDLLKELVASLRKIDTSGLAAAQTDKTE